MFNIKELVDEVNELEVEFYGNPHSIDNGYDSGEAWGAKYKAVVDKSISCEDIIEWDKKLYSKEHNDKIESYLQANYESIDKQICNKSEVYEKDRY